MTDFTDAQKEAFMNDIFRGDIDSVRRKIADGMPLNEPLPKTTRYGSVGSSIQHRLPLHLAAERHLEYSAELIVLLVESGAKTEPSPAPETPLMLAARANQWENFHTLLDCGADPYYAPDDKSALDTLQQNTQGPPVPMARIMYDRYTTSLKLWFSRMTEPETRNILIDDNGQASPMARAVAYAHAFPQVFSAGRWRGHEVEAIKLYDDVLQALPDKVKPYLRNDVDLSVLSTAALGSPENTAIGRYTRASAQSREAGR